MGLFLQIRDRGDQQHQWQGPDHVHLHVLRRVVAGAPAPDQLLGLGVDRGQDRPAKCEHLKHLSTVYQCNLCVRRSMSHRRFSSTFGIRSSRFTAWTRSADSGCSRRCRASGSTRTRQSPTSWGSGSPSHAVWTLTITPWMLKHASFKLEAVSRKNRRNCGVLIYVNETKKWNNIPPASQKLNKLTNRTLSLTIRVLRTKSGHFSNLSKNTFPPDYDTHETVTCVSHYIYDRDRQRSLQHFLRIENLPAKYKVMDLPSGTYAACGIQIRLQRKQMQFLVQVETPTIIN